MLDMSTETHRSRLDSSSLPLKGLLEKHAEQAKVGSPYIAKSIELQLDMGRLKQMMWRNYAEAP